LRQLAAELRQPRGLFACFDSLGHGVELEGAAQLDDGMHERGLTRALRDVLDERSVDLDRVEREAAQVAE
jgi:hypothetical protein